MTIRCTPNFDVIPIFLFVALALAAYPSSARAQIIDTFDTISPAWVTDRYAPVGFESVNFNGDNRLRITLGPDGSTAIRPAEFSDPFYNTQGRKRSVGITGLWTLSAQVYVSSIFNTTSGQLASSDLWGHSGTTLAGGAYMNPWLHQREPHSWPRFLCL
jgi:hypothetical protein